MPADEPTPDFLTVTPSGIAFRVQPGVYGSEPIAAAVHRYTDRCFVHLEGLPDGSLLCRVVPRRTADDIRDLAGALANELLDQMLRHKLQVETEPIRRLLLAQAFSHTNILHPEVDDGHVTRDVLHVIDPEAPNTGT